MRRFVAVFTVLAILAIAAVALAGGRGGYGYGPGGCGGPGGGSGYGMMGYGPGMMWGGDQATSDEAKKFFADTADLRKKMHDKMFDYREALRAGDEKKADALWDEIDDMRDQIRSAAKKSGFRQGRRGFGPGMMWGDDDGQATSDEAKKFFADTADLRKKMHDKMFDYREALRAGDEKKADALDDEIDDIRDQIRSAARKSGIRFGGRGGWGMGGAGYGCDGTGGGYGMGGPGHGCDGPGGMHR